MMPAWLPVKDTASTPSSASAMHNNAMDTRSPGGEEHVELARRLHGAHVARQAQQVVGRLAHGAHDHDHVGALAPGPGDVVGHGAHPLGVAHRRPAELLHHQRHVSKLPGVRTGPHPRAPGGTAERRHRPPGCRARPDAVGELGAERRRIGCRAVPTEKRARKRAAREAKMAAIERQRRRRARTRRGRSPSSWSPPSSSASTSLLKAGPQAKAKVTAQEIADNAAAAGGCAVEPQPPPCTSRRGASPRP